MLEIQVIGAPAPQGSKKGFYNKKLGRVLLVESSKKVKPWRAAVVDATLAVMGRDSHSVPAVSGPIRLRIVFTMPRPKSAKAGAYADKRPDISKLLRCTEDALTDAGAWEDDSRVVTVIAQKLYVGDEDALNVPGARIIIKGINEV